MEQIMVQQMEQSVSNIPELRLYGKASIICCIDTVFEGGGASGRLLSQYSENAIAFTDLADMLLQANDLYDDFCFPQAAMEMRSLKYKKNKPRSPQESIDDPPVEFHTMDRILRQRGKQYTAYIHVIYRQHCSWQGEIYICRGAKNIKKHAYFRSAMELLSLLRDANMSMIEPENDTEKTESEYRRKTK